MTTPPETAYAADRSIFGKVRRRLSRIMHRRRAPRGPDRPLLSITFDDAPLSATGLGADILERHGVRGTFYAAAGLCGQLAPMGVCAGPEDYLDLARRGHEVGCHTHSHLDCGQASGSEIREDVDLNAAAFQAWGLPAPENFAYPYGDVSAAAKSTLTSRFNSLRALHPGLVSAGTDLNQAPAVGIEGPEGEATARHWLKRAKAEKAWLILYTHDVAPSPSAWGCTPEALDRLVQEAKSKGFDIVTVKAGIEAITSATF